MWPLVNTMHIIIKLKLSSYPHSGMKNFLIREAPFFIDTPSLFHIQIISATFNTVLSLEGRT